MTSIDELVREAEETKFEVSVESELEGLLHSLDTFQQELTWKLQHIQDTQEHRTPARGREGHGISGVERELERAVFQGCSDQRLNIGVKMQDKEVRRVKNESPGETMSSRDQNEGGQDEGNEAGDNYVAGDDGDRGDDGGGDDVSGNDDDGSGDEEMKAQRSLAETLQELTSLNVQLEDHNVTSGYQERRASRPRIVSSVVKARPSLHTISVSTEGSNDRSSLELHEDLNRWSQMEGPVQDLQPVPTPNRIKFDIKALDRALSNLLRMTGEPMDPQMWEGSTHTLTDVPSTPPPTPASYVHDNEEYLPPPRIVMGPPPPKPPRVKIPINEALKDQRTHLSKSMGNLTQEIYFSDHDNSSQNHHSPLSARVLGSETSLNHHPTLSAHTATSGDGVEASERKQNIFLFAFRGKGMRDRVRDFTKKKKAKRIKSVDISEPQDFRHLIGSALTKQDAGQENENNSRKRFEEILVWKSPEMMPELKVLSPTEMTATDETDSGLTAATGDPDSTDEMYSTDNSDSTDDTATEDTDSTEGAATYETDLIEAAATDDADSTGATASDDADSTEVTASDDADSTEATAAEDTDLTQATTIAHAALTRATTEITATDNTGSMSNKATDDSDATEATTTDNRTETNT
nr:dentin sialophosphoprotein-like isoform X1 [Cherax quadricarinatus]